MGEIKQYSLDTYQKRLDAEKEVVELSKKLKVFERLFEDTSYFWLIQQCDLINIEILDIAEKIKKEQYQNGEYEILKGKIEKLKELFESITEEMNSDVYESERDLENRMDDITSEIDNLKKTIDDMKRDELSAGGVISNKGRGLKH